MILRRVTEHVKAQNWFAVAIDFVIVVAGVFIGIQVSNWNAARGERAAEAGYLEALEDDVVFSIASAETLIAHLEKQEAARPVLYAYNLDPVAVLDPAKRDSLMSHSVFHLPPVLINQTTFETLKSSGRLGIIRSPELVSDLQALSAQIADIEITQADEIQVMYMFTDPLLVEYFDMRGVFQQPNLENEISIPWLAKERIATPAPEVMKTRKFANAILYRSYFTQSRLKSMKAILDQHRRIASLIDARQAELGAGP